MENTDLSIRVIEPRSFARPGIEVKLLNLKENPIFYHEKLPGYFREFDDFVAFFSSNDQGIRSSLYPPVFLETNNGYYLVARMWIYEAYSMKGAVSLPAVVFKDEKLIDEILELQEREICGLKTIIPKTCYSSATRTKYRAIEAGQVCPFCDSNLKRSIKGNGIKERIVHCTNESYGGMGVWRCGFRAALTPWEYERFKRHQLPTQDWLKKLPDKECPNCRWDIFLRTFHRDDGAAEEMITCRDIYSATPECGYMRNNGDEIPSSGNESD